MKSAACLLLAVTTALTTPACFTTGRAAAPVPTASIPASAAVAEGTVLWKERLAQPYVYLDHVGDHRTLGTTLAEVYRRAQAEELLPAGPPFAIFADEVTAARGARQRTRAAMPVLVPPQGASQLGYDVLPRALVVFASFSGPYPDAPNHYPRLFLHLAQKGWVQAGPVREIYLVDPSTVAAPHQLRTEIQVPWRRATATDPAQRVRVLSSSTSGG